MANASLVLVFSANHLSRFCTRKAIAPGPVISDVNNVLIDLSKSFFSLSQVHTLRIAIITDLGFTVKHFPQSVNTQTYYIMADSENHSTITVDDWPVAARRERGRVGPNLRSRINSQTAESGCHSMSTPPATPRDPRNAYDSPTQDQKPNLNLYLLDLHYSYIEQLSPQHRL
jgi:hypothetical protein